MRKIRFAIRITAKNLIGLGRPSDQISWEHHLNPERPDFNKLERRIISVYFQLNDWKGALIT
jgi:hypothetical protein